MSAEPTFQRTITAEDLARLKAEREEADRRYNEALSALDAGLLRELPEAPHPPPPIDEDQVTPVNERWAILDNATPLPDRGWRKWLAAFIWRLVHPYFERQQGFNAALVDHMNRNVPIGRETAKAIASAIHFSQRPYAELASFQSLLITYLQQLTAYVDTKDREFAAHARELTEDNAVHVDRNNRDIARHENDILAFHKDIRRIGQEQIGQNDALNERAIGLASAISGVTDEMLKRYESMVARERRFDARVQSLTAAHEEVRAAVGAVQQISQALKRELDRRQTAGTAEPGRRGQQPALSGTPAAESVASVPTLASSFDAYKYVGFEDQFRGGQDDIRNRLTEYLPYFEGASDVLDLGCGRGEFLDLLRERGISARGLDVNREMVEICRSRGLQVDEGDALGFLNALPDSSLGGLLSTQVVEHLEPDYLVQVLDTAYHKLRPGSRIILETINPTCWFAFFESYLRDLTHVRPVHPDTLSYFLTASGFQKVSIRYRAPYPEHEKLQPLPGEGPLQDIFNGNVERLNGLLFTYLDYAAIGEKA